jgi:hypothetical protein
LTSLIFKFSYAHKVLARDEIYLCNLYSCSSRVNGFSICSRLVFKLKLCHYVLLNRAFNPLSFRGLRRVNTEMMSNYQIEWSKGWQSLYAFQRTFIFVSEHENIFFLQSYLISSTFFSPPNVTYLLMILCLCLISKFILFQMYQKIIHRK